MAQPPEEPIAWDQLEGAYGTAGEAGELLGLIEAGEDVWGELIDHVLHQGSLFDSTAPVVSWVIRFLKRVGPAVEASHKAEAFLFLSSAATSATQQPLCSPREAAGVLEALHQGIALYEEGLGDREPEVRLASAAIWKVVATDQASAFASVARGYERETHSEVRVTMLSALDALAETGQTWLDRLRSILDSATSRSEKFYAAAYLARRLGRSTPQAIADRLAELYPELPEAEYPVEVTNVEDADDLFWASVRALEISRAAGCLAKALRLCRDGYGLNGRYTLVSIVEWLLRLVSNDKRTRWGGTTSSGGRKIEYFGVEAPTPAGDWLRSPQAAAALKAIVNKGEFWCVQTNLLSLFGLPTGRKEVRELVRSLSAPPPSR